MDTWRVRLHTHCPAVSPSGSASTSLSLTLLMCKTKIKPYLTGPKETVGAWLQSVALPPAFALPGSRRKPVRGRTGLSASPAVSAEAAPHPTEWRVAGAPAGPMEGRPSLPPSLPPFCWGPRRETRHPGPQRLAGLARAWVPGNILAQNYIRQKVSIFCSILLPDLIVHLWQCLYTSSVQDNSVAAATGARQRCNLEINSFRVCLFQGETPSLSPGRVSPAPLIPRSHPTPTLGSSPFSPSKEIPGSHSPGWKSKIHPVT